MFLIFRPPPLPPTLTLTTEEFRHARARRLRPGDVVYVGDGHGRRQRGVLDDSRGVSLTAGTEECVLEAPARLISAIPEGKRLDWLAQKATELGLTELIPLRTARSEARDPGGARLERILEEAAAQSGRYVLPLLRPVLAFDRLLALGGGASDADPFADDAVGGAAVSTRSLTVYLDPRAETTLAGALRANIPGPADSGPAPRVPPDPARLAVNFVIGPEGGFTADERSALAAGGFTAVRLGRAILRVETAGVAALACLAAWRE